jgi:ethanolamine ammonia-lyase small subunit
MKKQTANGKSVHKANDNQQMAREKANDNQQMARVYKKQITNAQWSEYARSTVVRVCKKHSGQSMQEAQWSEYTRST